MSIFHAMLFSFEKDDDLSFESCRIPEAMVSFALPFSQSVYRRSDRGDILTQWVLGSDYSFWIHYFFIRRATTIATNVRENMFSLVLLRKGSIEGQLAGFGKVTLTQGKSYLFYVPAGLHHAHLKPDFYSVVEINFDSSHLVPIAGLYPEFLPLLSHTLNDFKDGWRHSLSQITQEADDIVDQILQTKMNVAERSLFLGARIRDLLRWYISDQAKQKKMAEGRGDEGEKTTAKLLRYIEDHLDEDLSVERLAGMMKLPTALLQRILRKSIGKPVHVVVNDKRMEQAAFLLWTTGAPVGEIVSKVSPISFQSFCTSFKKHFGVRPGEYRKRSGENQNK